MTTYDLGDGVNLDHLVYDRDGALTNATVALVITRPNGTTFPSPAITNPSTGRYRAATFVPDAVDGWSYAWVVTGAVSDVRPGTFFVANPAPEPYASLPEMKSWLGLEAEDTKIDDQIASALVSVSTEIDDVCGRTFNRDLVASTRTYTPAGAGLVLFDDFYTLTGLAVAVDGTSWVAADYRLKPANGVVNGRRWPYNRMEARTYPFPLGWESVSVTARWGWESVPAPVREACKIATADTLGLKDARFGVAGFGQYGDIRVRGNAMVMAKLQPYVRLPVKVA